jgi:uncharacterized protein (DUF2062 family)/2-polyprenyl-3-methyl-5-hydroxy-6-metoxy-1,4-benzoquinol methylase
MGDIPGDGARAARLRRFVRDLRTEGGGPGRDAVAVAVGVFIGSLPFYGLHLLICVAAGALLRLNRLKVYVAANISNPFMAPLLILCEVQTGALARRGELRSLTLDAVRQLDPWSFGADLLVGSVIVGGVLGLALGSTTWLLTRDGPDDPLFSALVRRAADRYVAASIVAWEFARGKLRADPIYRTVLTGSVLHAAAGRGSTLVDVGCGSGLMLALLAEAAAYWRAGGWPGDRAAPPVFEQLIGIELRPRVAQLARTALGDRATIVEEDARRSAPVRCDAILFFDLLHMLPRPDQERLLRTLGELLTPNGVILVREADAAAGWRFRAVSVGNRFKALAFGHWRQTFHFRTSAEWAALFEHLGFDVSRRDTGDGTPFANVLFVLTRG